MSRCPLTVGGDIKDRALLAKGDPAGQLRIAAREPNL